MLKRSAEWLKNVKKSNAEWLKNVKKYTHYLDYENYSQSVLSKLISGSFALVSLRMVCFFKPTRERFTKY